MVLRFDNDQDSNAPITCRSLAPSLCARPRLPASIQRGSLLVTTTSHYSSVSLSAAGVFASQVHLTVVRKTAP